MKWDTGCDLTKVLVLQILLTNPAFKQAPGPFRPHLVCLPGVQKMENG